MIEPIFITGAGIISPIGVGKEETLVSLLSGKTGIGQMRYLTSCHKDLPVGEVKLSNDEMCHRLGISNDPHLSRTVLLGRIALREALEQAGVYGHDLRKVHLISSTTVAGMDRRELYYEQESTCDKYHAMIATHNCGDCTRMIADPFGPFASLSTVSTACSSATNAIIIGANMIQSGLADMVVVGGAECLSLFHLNGFNSLMILAQEQCKPFDKNRVGLNLGEGAAYLVMESSRSLESRGHQPLCLLSGYGNACDAYHQTASSPNGDGAYAAMAEALQTAGLKPEDIQYINAHGTGTPNNDESESVAIKRLFAPHLPMVSSTKSFTGHTTSASGAIEAVICMLAMSQQFVPVNLNWTTPMDNGIVPVTVLNRQVKLRNILSNAFSFGGNDSSLIFTNIDN